MPASGHGEKRSRKWEAAIAALLEQPTIEKAAEKAGVAYSTLKGWVKLPELQVAYRETRRRILEHAVGRLQQLAGAAATVLQRVMRSTDEGTALKAAVAALDRALRGAELMDLAERVEELERQAARRRKREAHHNGRT